MKKIILIIISILVVGCSAEYNIVLDEKSIKEELDVYISEKEYNSLDEMTIANMIMDFERGYEFYNKEDLLESSSKLGYKYKYNNSYEYFASESQAARCYENIKIDIKDTIRIETSEYFECYDLYDNLDELTINIKTKNKVLNNNADKVKGITYTWNINKNNYQNKPIIIEINKEKNEISNTIIYIIVGCILVGIISLLLLLKIKKANNV